MTKTTTTKTITKAEADRITRNWIDERINTITTHWTTKQYTVELENGKTEIRERTVQQTLNAKSFETGFEYTLYNQSIHQLGKIIVELSNYDIGTPQAIQYRDKAIDKINQIYSLIGLKCKADKKDVRYIKMEIIGAGTDKEKLERKFTLKGKAAIQRAIEYTAHCHLLKKALPKTKAKEAFNERLASLNTKIEDHEKANSPKNVTPETEAKPLEDTAVATAETTTDSKNTEAA